MVKRRDSNKTGPPWRAGDVSPPMQRAEDVNPPMQQAGSVSFPVTCHLPPAVRRATRSAASHLAMVISVIGMTLTSGCGPLREYVPEWTKAAEDDPLRGRVRPAVTTTNPASPPDRIPAWTDASRPRDGQSGTSPDRNEAAALPPVLPPSPARLAVVPPLKGDHALAIETPARQGRRPPIQQTGGTDPKTAREQALEQLRARGVNWHQSEPIGGQWRLRCTVPDPNRSDVSRFYEAYGADELAALWAVIQQIDDQRQRSGR